MVGRAALPEPEPALMAVVEQLERWAPKGPVTREALGVARVAHYRQLAFAPPYEVDRKKSSD